MVDAYLSQKQRRLLAILLFVIAALFAIVFLAGFNTIYFEPTTEALDAAHAAYPIIVAGSIAALVGSLVACNLARKRSWLFVLAPTIGILSMSGAVNNGFFVQFMILAAIPIFVILANEIQTNKPTDKIGNAVMSIMSLLMLAVAGCVAYVTLNPLDQKGLAQMFLSLMLTVQILLTKFPLVFLAPVLAIYAIIMGAVYLHIWASNGKPL